MQEQIESDVTKIQYLIDQIDETIAINVRITIGNNQCIEHWWNENSFLKSALQSELRNLKLELLNLDENGKK